MAGRIEGEGLAAPLVILVNPGGSVPLSVGEDLALLVVGEAFPGLVGVVDPDRTVFFVAGVVGGPSDFVGFPGEVKGIGFVGVAAGVDAAQFVGAGEDFSEMVAPGVMGGLAGGVVAGLEQAVAGVIAVAGEVTGSILFLKDLAGGVGVVEEAGGAVGFGDDAAEGVGEDLQTAEQPVVGQASLFVNLPGIGGRGSVEQVGLVEVTDGAAGAGVVGIVGGLEEGAAPVVGGGVRVGVDGGGPVSVEGLAQENVHPSDPFDGLVDVVDPASVAQGDEVDQGPGVDDAQGVAVQADGIVVTPVRGPGVQQPGFASVGVLGQVFVLMKAVGELDGRGPVRAVGVGHGTRCPVVEGPQQKDVRGLGVGQLERMGREARSRAGSGTVNRRIGWCSDR